MKHPAWFQGLVTGLIVGAIVAAASHAYATAVPQSDWNERSARALEDIASKMGKCCK